MAIMTKWIACFCEFYVMKYYVVIKKSHFEDVATWKNAHEMTQLNVS